MIFWQIFVESDEEHASITIKKLTIRYNTGNYVEQKSL